MRLGSGSSTCRGREWMGLRGDEEHWEGGGEEEKGKYYHVPPTPVPASMTLTRRLSSRSRYII